MDLDAATRLLTPARRRHLLSWLLVLLPLALLFGRTWIRQVEFAAGPDNLCDDVRIVNYYFWRITDPSLFGNDVLGRYHAEGTSELYRALYYAVAKAGLWDAFTRFAPFVLFLICLGGMASAAHAIGGPVAALMSLALCLSSPLMLARMAGVLPRAFAFPILALMAAALVTGRIRAIAILTLLGAGFYPVITLIGMLTLGLMLFVYPPADRGLASGWSLKRRLLLLCVTGAACAILTVPFALRMSSYGHTITPDELAEFPEAGPGGRHDSVTVPPYAPLTEAWEKAGRTALRGAGPALLPSVRDAVQNDSELQDRLREWLAYLTVAGTTLLGLRRNVAMRRLAALAVAVGVGYLLARSVAPRLVVPERYVLYGVPVIAALTVPTFVLGFLPASWNRGKSSWVSNQAICLLASGVAVLALFGHRGDTRGGLGSFINESDKPLFNFVARLPPDVLVAGWPMGTLDTLSVATHRTAFLSRELHVPYHSGMTLLMRRRMEALIDAYFAVERAQLVRLNREFGVSHLVVEPARLESVPRYFRPFQPAIDRAYARTKRQGFEFERLDPGCAVFRNDKHVLLDLACVAK